jgi:ribulose-phosphate 3-epimerase
MKQTEKISELLDINPNLEIGWDGGINDKNVTELIKAGVDVLNAGGFIQKSTNPANAYAILQQIASVHK